MHNKALFEDGGMGLDKDKHFSFHYLWTISSPPYKPLIFCSMAIAHLNTKA